MEIHSLIAIKKDELQIELQMNCVQNTPKTKHTNLAEVPLEMAQLQALLQLGAVALPEVVEGRLRVIQLTQEPAGRWWGRCWGGVGEVSESADARRLRALF